MPFHFIITLTMPLSLSLSLLTLKLDLTHKSNLPSSTVYVRDLDLFLVKNNVDYIVFIFIPFLKGVFFETACALGKISLSQNQSTKSS